MINIKELKKEIELASDEKAELFDVYHDNIEELIEALEKIETAFKHQSYDQTMKVLAEIFIPQIGQKG